MQVWPTGPCRSLLVLLSVATCASAASQREMVEADWLRQDESRMAQIRDPGLVRFAEAELSWPGVAPDARRRVPLLPSPKIDGRLDDGCWAKALVFPPRAEGMPTIYLAHGEERLHVAISLPSKHEVKFQGPSTALDAGGAVDGIKDGRYAFHTGLEPNPWWQVDLGAPRALGKIVVYNRLDYAPGLHNADCMRVLTSLDKVEWTLLHDCAGEHFGGISGAHPLTVEVRKVFPEGLKARFVRLQLKSDAPIFFHLDEVEIRGEEDPARNLALHRPAEQSSLSIWSRGGLQGGGLLTLGNVKLALDPAGPSGMTLGGARIPDGQGRLAREGEMTFVELSVPSSRFPAGFPETVELPGGDVIAVTPGGRWTVAIPEGFAPGFGRNRLEIGFRADGPKDLAVDLRVESVVFTPRRPERRVVFSRPLSASEDLALDFEIDHEGPAALIIEAGDGKASFRDGRCAFIHPVAEALGRAGRLTAAFGRAEPAALPALKARSLELEARERAMGPDPEARAALCREARWLAREVAFRNPLLDFKEILFVKRFTQESYPDVCLNHMPWVSRPGGDICILSLQSPHEEVPVRAILRGALGPGHVHGMDLWWDGTRVVFGYARAKSPEPPEGWLDRRTSYDLRRTQDPIHIFEVGLDGSQPRQLTFGEWSDLDPTYLASGDIAFVSERCRCSLQCNEYDKDETSCNLYVMRPDGTGIRRLSVTKDGDYLPHALDDGTIAYTRWEYQERGWAHIQSIWTVRPDGTGADAIFKQHFNEPWALEDMRSIPGSEKLVAIATGHHTLPAGPLVLVDPTAGINNSAGIQIVTPGIAPPEGGMSGRTVPEGGVPGKGGYCMTPWPLSEEFFLVSRNYGAETERAGHALYLMDVFGTLELIYRDPEISCFYPIPMKARRRPPILPEVTDPGRNYAICALSEVWRGVEGVDPKSIKYLRVSQRIPWPYDNESGGQRYEPDVKSIMINWTPARVLGVVPLEPDGSARFRVPVDTAVYFQILDGNFMELRRMRSFISFQPGEDRGCTGCHETRAAAPAGASPPKALLRDPVEPAPPPWGQKPISFLREVQPVLDRHCASCHSGLEPAGGLDFSGGLTARHNKAYDTILEHGLVARSNVGEDARITQPLAFGSHKSKLIHAIKDDRHSKRVNLGPEEWLRLVTWVDANGPYHDAFINKRLPVMPYELPLDRELADAIAAVHTRRCSSCHAPGDVSRADWIDLRSPGKSLFLRAPLAKEAGGDGTCREPSYKDRADPDYEMLARLVGEAVRKAWERPRRDLVALKGEERVGALVPAPGPLAPEAAGRK